MAPTHGTSKQGVEKRKLPSLRAQRSNPGFSKFNKLEIASSPKTLLAMTKTAVFQQPANCPEAASIPICLQ
jgi:hypothetical protein